MKSLLLLALGMGLSHSALGACIDFAPVGKAAYLVAPTTVRFAGAPAVLLGTGRLDPLAKESKTVCLDEVERPSELKWIGKDGLLYRADRILWYESRDDDGIATIKLTTKYGSFEIRRINADVNGGMTINGSEMEFSLR